MNKCLNCEKEVLNKYCNVTCQNQHKGKLNQEKYYWSPKLCKNCKEVIKYENRRNSFCNRSCAGTFNNKGLDIDKINNVDSLNKNINKTNLISDEEFIEFVNTSKSWRELILKLGYSEKFGSTTKNTILNKANLLNIKIDFKPDLIKSKTKKEIFELSKNWQSARTTIRKDACKVFEKSNKEYKCAICGYTNHVEIAHIKAVSDFTDDSLLTDINNIENLIALCPNHHWEYDNKLINL